MCAIEALGEERALFGRGVLESLLLIYILESEPLGEFSEIFGLEHCKIRKNFQ